MVRLSAPAPPDLSKYKTDKKITDEEILKILDQPTAKPAGEKKKTKKKKKKPAKKATEEEEDDDDDDDDE